MFIITLHLKASIRWLNLTPSEALKKSVRLVALENDLVDRTAKPKADMAKLTKKTNTKAKLVAAKKERGKLSGTGGGNSRPDIDISRMWGFAPIPSKLTLV